MRITPSWSFMVAGLFSYEGVFCEDGTNAEGYWQSNSLSFFWLDPSWQLLN